MLGNKFRELWSEHVMWTRSFIISTAASLGDLNYVTKRLLRNPADFEKALMSYYGRDKASRFKNLLEEHLLIAGDLVNSAKMGDMKKVDEDRTKWYKNADDMAMFLGSINPYWNRQEWKNMLYEHLKMTEDEATARLEGRYQDDVMMYDDIESQAMKMADYMSSGIMKQFRI